MHINISTHQAQIIRNLLSDSHLDDGLCEIIQDKLSHQSSLIQRSVDIEMLTFPVSHSLERIKLHVENYISSKCDIVRQKELAMIRRHLRELNNANNRV